MNAGNTKRGALFGSPNQRSLWLLFIFGIPLLGAVVSSVSAAWGERRVIAEFAEHFVASLLWQVGHPGACSFFTSVFVGFLIWNRWNLKWLAILAGGAFFVLIWLGTASLAKAIPGVGWRYERIEEQWLEDDDYDREPYWIR